MPLLPVLVRMELAGVTIDREALAAMAIEFGAQLAALEARIYARSATSSTSARRSSSSRSSSTS